MILIYYKGAPQNKLLVDFLLFDQQQTNPQHPPREPRRRFYSGEDGMNAFAALASDVSSQVRGFAAPAYPVDQFHATNLPN
jgi:hypothetical protein